MTTSHKTFMADGLFDMLSSSALAQSSGIVWKNGNILTAQQLQQLDNAKMNVDSLGKPGFAPKLNDAGQITDPVVGDVSKAIATPDGQTVAEVAAKANEDFLVTDAMWCAYVSGLPTSDPTTAGSFWNNAGVVTCSASGLSFTGNVSRKISVAAIHFWMDGLPASDPNTAGAVWNNAGVPTVSVAGVGDVSSYTGPKISDSSLNFLLLEMPKLSGNTIPDTGFTNIWINNSSILTRI